jgi:hypothetical protein
MEFILEYVYQADVPVSATYGPRIAERKSKFQRGVTKY